MNCTAAPIGPIDLEGIWDLVAKDAIAAMERVGRSGRWLLGAEVRHFENDLASFWPAPAAVGCGNGLDALEIALRALNLEPGARVLTTPLSAFATTLAILRAGLRPVFCDVDTSGLLDLDLAREVLRAEPDIAAILPVHLYGHALDLDALDALGQDFGIEILEDCAQAIGARWGERPVGSVSRLAATSFYPTKNLGCIGDGGAVLVNDPSLEQRVRRLRDYGRSSTWEHAELGLNSRLDELQAALLRSAFLPRLPAWTERRRDLAAALQTGLDHPLIQPLPQPPKSASVWHLFPVRVGGAGRESLREHLVAAGIHSGLHYPILIPDQPAAAGLDPLSLATPIPLARALAGSELSLPLHPLLEDAAIDRIIVACNNWNHEPL